jgi:ribosomal protein S14
MDKEGLMLIWDYDQYRYETYKRLKQAAQEREEREEQEKRRQSGQCIVCGQRLTFVQKLFGKDRHDGCKSFKE